MVVPGSHRYPPGKLPPAALAVEANAGDVVCHSHSILHSSGPVLEAGGERATLYLYFCGGKYPGPGLPFASDEKKEGIRTLFMGERA
jgi:ectoine hydroxylase-related dioxygenase (phytanoyl-CoA dioxygenase family)